MSNKHGFGNEDLTMQIETVNGETIEYKYLGQGESYDRALNAYFHSGYNNQPSNIDSGECELDGAHYVVFRNVNGVLAVYKVNNNGYLRELENWPVELEEW